MRARRKTPSSAKRPRSRARSRARRRFASRGIGGFPGRVSPRARLPSTRRARGGVGPETLRRRAERDRRLSFPSRPSIRPRPRPRPSSRDRLRGRPRHDRAVHSGRARSTTPQGRRRVQTRREFPRRRGRTRRRRIRRGDRVRARVRLGTSPFVHVHLHDALVPFDGTRRHPRGRRRLIVGVLGFGVLGVARGGGGVASYAFVVAGGVRGALAGWGSLGRDGGERLRGVAGGAEGAARSRANVDGDGDGAGGDARAGGGIRARSGRGEGGAVFSNGATTGGRGRGGRGCAERLVGAPGAEGVRAERRAVLLEVVQEVGVVRGVVRVAVEGGVGGVAVASSARARHAPSRAVLAAGRGQATGRRAAAAQRRRQVLGREHLPRRRVPQVHVRVGRVRENRPRGHGRGGASLRGGEGRGGTEFGAVSQPAVGQRKTSSSSADGMGFKTRGERGGTFRAHHRRLGARRRAERERRRRRVRVHRRHVLVHRGAARTGLKITKPRGRRRYFVRLSE